MCRRSTLNIHLVALRLSIVSCSSCSSCSGCSCCRLLRLFRIHSDRSTTDSGGSGLKRSMIILEKSYLDSTPSSRPLSSHHSSPYEWLDEPRCWVGPQRSKINFRDQRSVSPHLHRLLLLTLLLIRSFRGHSNSRSHRLGRSGDRLRLRYPLQYPPYSTFAVDGLAPPTVVFLAGGAVIWHIRNIMQ